MRILFIAPLPPPITGQSVASSAILDQLNKKHNVSVVNFSKGTFRQGVNSIRRIIEVGQTLVSIIDGSRKSDVIYLTISQSTAGVLKDAIIYLCCYKKLDTFVIHSHGNGIKKLVFERHFLLRVLTTFFYRRISRLIVLGPTHVPVFSEIMPEKKISIVFNYADDELFLDDSQIVSKCNSVNSKINLLFLSNLLPGKGHWELLDAFISLPEHVKSRFSLTFAGGFESDIERNNFLARAADTPDVHYCGVVQKEKKIELFKMAHVFCLPTSYPYEGQPISILEAYASGCVVVTTAHAGIRDIFTDMVHGIEVDRQSPESISEAIVNISNNPEVLLKYGLSNALEARQKYRRERFSNSVEEILESVYARSELSEKKF